MKTKTVLVDATSINARMKGVGRYAWQLCDALEMNRPSFGRLVAVIFRDSLSCYPRRGSSEVIGIPYTSEFKLGMHTIPNLVHSSGASVLIRPADKIGRPMKNSRQFTVCHDLNKWIWEHQPKRTLLRRNLDAMWEILRIRAMRTSELVVCNSEFVRHGVVELLGIERDKTAIGHCGVDPLIPKLASVAAREHIPWIRPSENYCLAFATGDEREGYSILPTLFAAARRSGYTGKLVLAGTKSSLYQSQLQRAFEAEELGDSVIWVPFLGKDQLGELGALYRFADFYLETSKHEGFGMQLVEAMACGTTCFSSGKGALDEISGGFALPLNVENPAQAGKDLAAAWLAGEAERDNVHQVRYALGFDWSDARRLVSEFAWGI